MSGGRILLFTPGLGEAGGAARRSRLFAEGLAEQGHEVVVISRSGSGHRVARRRAEGIWSIEVPGFGRRRLGAVLYAMLALPLGLVLGRSARGMVAIQLTAPGTIASICALVWRTPFIVFTSTTGELSEVDAVLGSRTAPIRRRLLGRARHLVGQSVDSSKELERLVSPDRVAVLPTPVRLSTSEASALARTPTVAWSGRLSAEKDLLRLIDAWLRVLDEVPDGQLTLVGGGSEHRSIEDELRARVAADDRLGASVHITGWVGDAASVVARSDVFVLPSLTEGMSNSLLEACALGRVLVASDIPGNRAVVGDGYPLLFPPGDTVAMTDALLAALTDDDVRARSLAQLQARIETFALPTVIDGLLRLLDGGDAGHEPGRNR